MKMLWWKSLRTKIIAWSFVPTVIILSAVAWFTFYSYQRVLGDLAIKQDFEILNSKIVKAADAINNLINPSLQAIILKPQRQKRKRILGTATIYFFFFDRTWPSGLASATAATARSTAAGAQMQTGRNPSYQRDFNGMLKTAQLSAGTRRPDETAMPSVRRMSTTLGFPGVLWASGPGPVICQRMTEPAGVAPENEGRNSTSASVGFMTPTVRVFLSWASAAVLATANRPAKRTDSRFFMGSLRRIG